MANLIKMYTDGGARNNPGPAAVGVWIETLNKKYAEYIGEKSNNAAEYEALIFGLKKIRQLLGKDKTGELEIECYLDSELVAKQMNHEYKIKEPDIAEKFIAVWNLTLDFKNVRIIHIPREKNKIADKLVNQALNEKQKQGSLI